LINLGKNRDGNKLRPKEKERKGSAEKKEKMPLSRRVARLRHAVIWQSL